MSAPRPTTCPLCEANCGLLVEVERTDGVDRIGSVRGDPDDPLSRGYICPKGASLSDIQHDPDRLRRPLRRENGRFVEIGWDEAFAGIAARIVELQAAHGRDTISLYYGNPTAHNYSAALYVMLWVPVLNFFLLDANNSIAGSALRQRTPVSGIGQGGSLFSAISKLQKPHQPSPMTGLV